MKTELTPLLKLGKAERLQLVEDLWDSIVREGDELPLPGYVAEELRGRKVKFAKNPESGRTWEQVKKKARS